MTTDRDVPEGFRLVPVEPTPEMLEAAVATPGVKAVDALIVTHFGRTGQDLLGDQPKSPLQQAWLAMLAAAPLAPAPAREDDWRCPECRCRTFARVDHLVGNRFEPGPQIRCVHCKRVFDYPAAPAREDDAVALLRRCLPILKEVFPCGSDELCDDDREKWRRDNERLVFAPARALLPEIEALLSRPGKVAPTVASTEALREAAEAILKQLGPMDQPEHSDRSGIIVNVGKLKVLQAALASARQPEVAGEPTDEALIEAIHEGLGGNGWAYSNYGGDERKNLWSELQEAADRVRKLFRDPAPGSEGRQL